MVRVRLGKVPNLAKCQIAIKELFPIVVALELWGTVLENKKILFMTDNMAIVHAIDKQTCKGKALMKFLRRLVLQALSHNILFRAKHIAEKSNTLADHLSRFKFQAWKPQLSLQISVVDVCNFIGQLFIDNYSPSTIFSHISAISYICTQNLQLA